MFDIQFKLTIFITIPQSTIKRISATGMSHWSYQIFFFFFLFLTLHMCS